MSDALPVVDPPEDPPTHGRVVGVLLAAGTSSRYGEANKLLAEVDGDPIVARAAGTLLSADLDGVVAVTGFDAVRVRAALPDGVDVVHNDDYRQGQATSVAAGVRAARVREADAAVFALGDMPWIDPDSVGALVAAYAAGLGDALAAACDGQRGNPALFDARHFESLAAVEGDQGGRSILLDGGTLVETGDRGVLRDVDRPADLG